MPIRETSEIPAGSDLSGVQFVVFYSSRDENGTMWCPDCRAVEGLVQETFGPDGPSALIVYVGQRSEWKTPSNVFRTSSWKVDGVPTIIKVEGGREIRRLGEHEVTSELAALAHGT